MAEPLAAANPFLDSDMQRQLAIYFGNDYTHVGRREVEPLLSILQRIKFEYKGTEIWTMLLQHLHDYLHFKDGFRLPRQKVINYIEILMDKNPDLAECLISNLPIIKVPMIMATAGAKRDLNITSIDPSLLSSGSKRCRTETPFYNFSTPAVNAYLASQGKPLRVVSSPASIHSAKPTPGYSLLTSGSSAKNSDIPTTVSLSSSNIKKVSTNAAKTINSSALTTEQMNQILINHRQNISVQLKPEDQNQLNQLERNKLKMAIHRLHLEGKLRALHSGIKVSDGHGYFLSSPSSTSKLGRMPIKVKLGNSDSLIQISSNDPKTGPLQRLQAMVDKSGEVKIKEEPESPPPAPVNIDDEPLDMTVKKDLNTDAEND